MKPESCPKLYVPTDWYLILTIDLFTTKLLMTLLIENFTNP